ncbi:Geraniol 8-hydroxylase, partial [Mucuna pruriens]
MTHVPIMRLKLGQLTTIVISSLEIAKEVLQIHNLFSKPNNTTSHNSSQPQPLQLILPPHFTSLERPQENMQQPSPLTQAKTLDATNCTNSSMMRIQAASMVKRTSINFLSNTFISLDFVNSVGETEEYKGIVENLVRAIEPPNVVDFFRC